MILQIFGPYGKIGVMRMSEAGNEAAEGGRRGGTGGSLLDPPRWESRRLCPVFPRGFSPCSHHHPEALLSPGPAVIPVLGTAMSGLWPDQQPRAGGNGMESLSLSLGKPWMGPPGVLGCSGARVSRGFPTGMDACVPGWSQVLSLAGAYPCVPCIPAGSSGCSIGFAVEGRGCPVPLWV